MSKESVVRNLWETYAVPTKLAMVKYCSSSVDCVSPYSSQCWLYN